jgi:vacuolar-type H+-ATPase subunit C/Vma6
VTDWSDVVSRARGLSSRLLGARQLAQLRACRDDSALADELGLLGLIPPRERGSPVEFGELESALRRRAGARLRILERWAGDRAHLLAPLIEDEDYRSVRTLLRGAAGLVAPEWRLAGLVPTRALPMRALEQLAHLADLQTIAAQLLAWRHPFGAELSMETSGPRPDLFRVELALARVFFRRARAAARAGDEALRLFVRRTIDLENFSALLVVADGLSELEPGSVFIPGGDRITLGDVELAARSRNRATVEAALAPRAVGTPLAAAMNPARGASEDATLDALVAEFRARARADPLSLASVISFVLRQRRELSQLFRIIWSVALRVPPESTAVAWGATA